MSTLIETALWQVDITEISGREPRDVAEAGAEEALIAIFGEAEYSVEDAGQGLWLVTLPEEAARELVTSGSLDRTSGRWHLTAEAPTDGDYSAFGL